MTLTPTLLIGKRPESLPAYNEPRQLPSVFPFLCFFLKKIYLLSGDHSAPTKYLCIPPDKLRRIHPLSLPARREQSVATCVCRVLSKGCSPLVKQEHFLLLYILSICPLMQMKLQDPLAVVWVAVPCLHHHADKQ